MSRRPASGFHEGQRFTVKYFSGYLLSITFHFETVTLLSSALSTIKPFQIAGTKSILSLKNIADNCLPNMRQRDNWRSCDVDGFE